MLLSPELSTVRLMHFDGTHVCNDHLLDFELAFKAPHEASIECYHDRFLSRTR